MYLGTFVQFAHRQCSYNQPSYTAFDFVSCSLSHHYVHSVLHFVLCSFSHHYVHPVFHFVSCSSSHHYVIIVAKPREWTTLPFLSGGKGANTASRHHTTTCHPQTNPDNKICPPLKHPCPCLRPKRPSIIHGRSLQHNPPLSNATNQRNSRQTKSRQYLRTNRCMLMMNHLMKKPGQKT